MATVIQIVVTKQIKKDLQVLAKEHKRTLSNMAGILLALGTTQYLAKQNGNKS